ncbi:protein ACCUMULATION AND REPLICATION OF CHLOROPLASTS 3, chloroplastic isoform X3 [Arachis hypogaea]|uniref:protein ACCUMULATION AND REPLICATION OF CHLOROPLASTS 3, chloroplastic isoform X3 n=1 Tax=Arachis hypogaea TaxID=3818 RepID=UPI000DED1246|nr:protein ACCUMULATION AND REPLICATION OF CHLOROPLASTS 3 isoform X3 [Arachis hypogaea]QHO36189.1 Protein ACCUMULATION AND REPLICATION OF CHLOROPLASTS [Arachis hypogaea]
MELSAFPTFRAVTNPSIFPFSSKQVCCRCPFLLRRRDYGLRWNRNSKPFVRIRLCLENASSSNGYGGTESGEAKPEFIEVIGIGSRKDAVIDFCLRSQFQLSSLRFWNIIMKESHEAQLQRRSREEEFSPTVVKAPVFMKTCSKTVVLVASAGYGLDLSVAVDIFETVRSRNGLAVAIVLRPFSFEGLRRQDEVKDLMGKLKESANLIIEIDIDALLQKDLLTLDEAMKTANNAVLLAIKAIYVLKSETHRKLVDRLQDGVTEASTSEVNKILANYKEAGIGFGAAYNIKTSILQSTLECPFLGVRLKDPTSIVICILASSVPINHSDIAAFLRTFRQTTAYTGDILVSTIYEPNVEPNLWITTVLALGSSNVKQSVQSVGILSRLALHFPRLFSFWGTHNQQQVHTGKECAVTPQKVMESYERDEEPNKNAAHFVDGSFNNHNEQLEPRVSSSSSKLATSRFSEKEDMFDSIAQNSVPYDSIIEDDYAFQREQLENWNLGPGYEVAREWAQERVADATHMIDNLSIFHLPVGVRPSEDLKDCLKVSFMTEQKEPESVNEVNVSTINEGIPSWNVVTDASLEAVKGLASSLLKGKDANKPKKHGVLSDRAASMLEAERDLSKKWNPVVEMQYRGGRYKGRCQGGLPEGKGWFYFHTGDRWFANFWKGKANGEGRFYSKSGDAFFGNFKDGWRHGQFLCINANGTRYAEIWEQGVLLDIKQLYR